MKLNKILDHYQFEPRDDITLAAIEHNLKLSCPGNFYLKWSKSTGKSIDIIFDDPAEQTLWMLKWL